MQLCLSFLLIIFFQLVLPAPFVSGDLTPTQEITIKQLTTIFENDTPYFRYGYCENIGDGRGYTAGIVGFTTSTDDLLEIVNIYARLVPDNELAQFIPALIAVGNSSSTLGLDDLCLHWHHAANDSTFRDIQDNVTNHLYWIPAGLHSDQTGLQLALTRGEIYDSIVQHGEYGEDGLVQMINETSGMMGGTPAMGVDEMAWIETYFNVRISHLENPVDPDFGSSGEQTTYRVYAYQSIANSSNWDLTLPFTITLSDGGNFTLQDDGIP